MVCATKMGATAEIAAAVAEQLILAGRHAVVRDAADIHDCDGFDAAVIGSAVYAGRRRSDAVSVLSRQAAQRGCRAVADRGGVGTGTCVRQIRVGTFCPVPDRFGAATLSV